MDNYTNENQNTYESGNGYPVDPNNNSYHYTGTENSANTYSAYTNTASNQDRYYSPYERRTAEQGSQKHREKKPKKQHGFGVTIAKCACLAAVFGLVAGGVFGGVNYLIPEKAQEIAVEETKESALAIIISSGLT